MPEDNRGALEPVDRAEEVPLSKRYASMTQDVVCRRYKEEEIRQGELLQIVVACWFGRVIRYLLHGAGDREFGSQHRRLAGCLPAPRVRSALLGSAGRLVVAPYAVGKRCHGQSGPCNLERLSLQVDSLVASGCVELGAPNLVRALVLGPAEA